MTLNAFSQIDHPLIVIAQVALAIALFRLFFSVRKSSAPLPQIIGATAISVLTNLTGRVMSSEWFFAADIFEYTCWAATAIASVYSVEHQKKEEARLPGAKPVVPDFFDRWQVKATWGFACIVIGVAIYAYVDTYMSSRHKEATAQIKADSAVTRATAEYSRQQYEDSQKQDSILTAIASISATQSTIIANQSHVIKQNEATHDQIDKKSAQTRRTVRQAVLEHRPIVPVQLETPKTIPTNENEKNLWQRFKGIFGARTAGDTLSMSRPDTTLRY
jgi:hypothetical protein